nr:unnamed protein product [Callosobruchus chinensis]
MKTPVAIEVRWFHTCFRLQNTSTSCINGWTRVSSTVENCFTAPLVLAQSGSVVGQVPSLVERGGICVGDFGGRGRCKKGHSAFERTADRHRKASGGSSVFETEQFGAGGKSGT